MNNKDYALPIFAKRFIDIPTQGKKHLVAWQNIPKKSQQGRNRDMVDTWPDANIASQRVRVSNTVVVDIDGGEVPSLPATVTSETSPGHFPVLL